MTLKDEENIECMVHIQGHLKHVDVVCKQGREIYIKYTVTSSLRLSKFSKDFIPPALGQPSFQATGAHFTMHPQRREEDRTG